MKTLDSLSLFVGTGQCNASCVHCAGKIHRKYAPVKDGIVDEDLIYKTLRECHEQGASSLSVSSSGEPTLSPLAVTKTFEIIEKCRKQGFEYPKINLYSNGIIIGEDQEFCKTYLKMWRIGGLKTLYITVHDIDEKRNAEVYQVKSYPKLNKIVSRAHQQDLRVRANLVLNKETIGTLEKFISTIISMKKIGIDRVSAWPIRDAEDKPDYSLSPSEEELRKMEDWAEQNMSSIPETRVLMEKSRIAYTKRKKLTLFPDGILSNTWCNY